MRSWMAPTINTMPTTPLSMFPYLLKILLGLIEIQALIARLPLSIPFAALRPHVLGAVECHRRQSRQAPGQGYGNHVRAEKQRSKIYATSGGRTDHNMTARLAQADTSISQPAIGKYQMAVAMMQLHPQELNVPPGVRLPQRAAERGPGANRQNECRHQGGRVAAAKYTSGIRIMPTSNLINTVRASDIGRDFQNKILRSLRSAYRQSSRYQVAYTDITT